MRTDAAKRIEAAVKFDFGELMLEGNGKTYEIPALSDAEREFWRDGFIPLPFTTCWYEFAVKSSRTAMLIEDRGEGWIIERIDFAEGETLYDGIVVALPKATALAPGGGWHLPVMGNTSLIEKLDSKGQFMQQAIGAMAPMAIYLTLMLHSRTTEIREEIPPPKLNRARLKRGVTPLARHRVVTIVPTRFRAEHTTVPGEKRRSPRLHWRRSHLRHLKDGKTVVIARMLVSKAEFGEVSHEYRIKGEE
jgi:hypothetical protein